MILVDTSVWIEFFRGRPDFVHVLGLQIEELKVVALECVFGELLQGARSLDEVKVLKEYWKNLPKIDESGIWVSAGTLSSQKKLVSKGVGLIDAAIVMAARTHDLRVWTLDKKLLGLLSSREIFVS